MITTLVIVAVIAATAAFCSRLERSTLRKVLLVTTVSFVCWTPLLFVSGSYDCDVDCLLDRDARALDVGRSRGSSSRRTPCVPARVREPQMAHSTPLGLSGAATERPPCDVQPVDGPPPLAIPTGRPRHRASRSVVSFMASESCAVGSKGTECAASPTPISSSRSRDSLR